MTDKTGETHRNSSALSFWVLAVALGSTAIILFLLLPRTRQLIGLNYNLGFADGYDLIANNLLEGHGYRFYAGMGKTMLREPGYPLFLAGVFKIGGYSITAARWANWILTIGIAFLMMKLAERVTHDKIVSLLATLIVLLYPGILVSEARAGEEILFILLVLAFIALLYRAIETGDVWRYLVAGLALGVVVQVRSTPLVFPFFLLVYLVLTNRRLGLKKTILDVGVLVLGTGIVLAPWVVRNFMLVHHLVPTATVQGVAMQEGQYTCEHLTLDQNFYEVQSQAGRMRAAIATELGLPFEGAYYYQVFYNPSDELAFSQALVQRAEKEYLEHPALLVACSCKNVANFWFLGRTWRATWLNVLTQGPFLALSFWGLYEMRKRGQLQDMGLMLTFAFSVMVVHLPVIAHARHSIPLIPFLSIPAALALVTGARRLRNRAVSS